MNSKNKDKGFKYPILSFNKQRPYDHIFLNEIYTFLENSIQYLIKKPRCN